VVKGCSDVANLLIICIFMFDSTSGDSLRLEDRRQRRAPRCFDVNDAWPTSQTRNTTESRDVYDM